MCAGFQSASSSVLRRSLAAMAAGLVIGLVPAAGMAQAGTEVSPDHWAYKAVQNLYNKVLVGYPDGAFRGTRPMSRYEFAAATYQLWRETSAGLDALKEQIEYQMRMGQPQNTAAEAELKKALTTIGEKISAREAAAAEFSKIFKEFEEELAGLGVDLDKLKKEIADIDKRVTYLEKKKPLLVLSGDVNLFALGGYSSSNTPGLLTSGYRTGLGEGSYLGQPVGVTRDLQILHEAAFTVKTQPEAPVRFKGTFTVGNLLASNAGYSSTSNLPLTEGRSDFAIDTAQAEWDFMRARGKGTITVGRYSHQVGPYLLQRPDTTTVYTNERWDDGGYRFDGAKLTFNWPGSEINVFGGRSGSINSLNGVDLTQPSIFISNALSLPIEQVLGFSGKFQLNKVASVSGGYMYLDANTQNPGPQSVNRMITLGGAAHFDFGGLKIDAGVAKPIKKNAGSTVQDNENEASFAEATFGVGPAKVTGGWRNVETFSFNNGDWGRFGTIQNPTGFTGYYGEVFVPIGTLSLAGRYEKAEGMGAVGTAGLGSKDSLENYSASLTLPVSDVWSLYGGFETTCWKFAAGTDPYQSWTTLSARARWSNTFMSFGVHMTDADSKGRAFLPAFNGSGRFKGGVLFSQVSLKF